MVRRALMTMRLILPPWDVVRVCICVRVASVRWRCDVGRSLLCWTDSAVNIQRTVKMILMFQVGRRLFLRVVWQIRSYWKFARCGWNKKSRRIEKDPCWFMMRRCRVASLTISALLFSRTTFQNTAGNHQTFPYSSKTNDKPRSRVSFDF